MEDTFLIILAAACLITGLLCIASIIQTIVYDHRQELRNQEYHESRMK
jgi:hypothetical protein